MSQRPRLSPVRVLTTKVLLWGAVPVLIPVVVVVGMATRETAHQRVVRELHQRVDEAERPRREQVKALLRELEKNPIAIANENAMAGMTPAQRAVKRRELVEAWLKQNGIR